ncbi:MAG: endolytic transglycosylase MltG [Candidatus Magasanikbacteria bacterium]|jgi:UPF0755 protein|nr:endolytic transglycosylase MltG [Candidatus Magasanikbacteria bacterium]
MRQHLYKYIGSLVIVGFFLALFFGVFFWVSVQKETWQGEGALTITVLEDETVAALARRLEEENTISSERLFLLYLRFKKLDTAIQSGIFSVSSPVTIRSIAQTLTSPTLLAEKEITILPGWDNAEIAQYLSQEGIDSKETILALIGGSAVDYRTKNLTVLPTERFPLTNNRPPGATLEGYLAPNTYRIFQDASAEDVVVKLLQQREKEFEQEKQVWEQSLKESGRSFHDVLIVASLLEKEVRGAKDKAIVADIFWRRLEAGWPLQADSTVHYLTQKHGSVFTTAADRATDSPWNTYKYPGLPLGPIANPSKESIHAALFPEANTYWYFLTTLDTGEVMYASTNDEHNANVAEHLR